MDEGITGQQGVSWEGPRNKVDTPSVNSAFTVVRLLENRKKKDMGSDD